MMWEKIQNFTEEKHEFVTGIRFELTHQEHKTKISYIVKPYDIQEGNWVQKPSIRLSIDFRGHELLNKFVDELKTDIFSAGAYIPKIWFASSDSQLIAYFLSALLKVMPDLSKEIEDIALSLSLNLSCAYASLPEWLYVRGEYEQTYLYTPRTNRITESVGLLRRNDLDELAIKVKILQQHFKNISQHITSKNDGRYESGAVVEYIVIHINKDEFYSFYDFLKDLKEVAPNLQSLEHALLMKAREYCGLSLTTNLLLNHPTNLTLIEKVLKSTRNPERLKSLLIELSDRLLNEQSSQVAENKKICEVLFQKIENHNNALNESMETIFPNTKAAINNAEDLKYFFMRTRYYDNFIHDQSDKYKDDHIALMLQILPDEFSSDLVYENGEFKGGEATIESLRRKLLVVMNKPYHDLLEHFGLMILSKYWPVNLEDPIELEAIPADKRLFVSTGHQFNIDVMREFNQSRDVRYQIESYANKKLINPITNTPVFPEDDAHIRQSTGINTSQATLVDGIPYLYGFRHWKKLFQLCGMLENGAFKSETIKTIIGNVQQERTMRLLDNMMTPWFVNGLRTLIQHGVKVDHFMNFSTEKQMLLATNHWLLTIFISGIPPEKIIALNVEKLIALDKWLYDRDFTQGPTIGEGWPNDRIINKNDLTLVMEKIEQLSIEDSQSNDRINLVKVRA